MAIVSVKRDHGLKVLLSESLYRDLEYVCERMGQTPAVVGSLAVSQYVADRKAVLEAAEASLDRLADRLVSSLGDDLRASLRADLRPSSSSSDGGHP
jgi:hypothetical protein